MVWFQCEDCGENLKKPKLSNHFRMCSAYKLSCIDCGEMFNQESVQNHNQCITEAEKYGPKGQGNMLSNGHVKTEKPKKNLDVDVNVGLSSRHPWFCSLCNTQATSKQTLLSHADGKKHRAKARAFHASQKQTDQTEDLTHIGDAISEGQKVDLIEADGSNSTVQEIDTKKDTSVQMNGTEKESKTKKRKMDVNDEQKNDRSVTNGATRQPNHSEASERRSKKKKGADEMMKDQAHEKEASGGKLKWKKLITSTLKSGEGVMKIKKLQKVMVKALRESGVDYDEEQLRNKLMEKINSSNRFRVDSKRVYLVSKTEET